MAKDKRTTKNSDAGARERFAKVDKPEMTFAQFVEQERHQAIRLRELDEGKTAPYRRGLPTMTPCGGGRFDKEIDPNEWQGGYGMVQFQPGPDPFANFTGGLYPGAINANPGPLQPGTAHQAWVGPGFDPVVNIPRTPPGVSGAVRIGNAIAYSGCELLSKTFTVDAAHSLIGFWYAVVLQDYQDHELTTRPFFWVRVADTATGAAIPGCVDFGGGVDRVFANILNNGFFDSIPATPPGFTPASVNPIVFKDWSFAQINLSTHVGQTVTLEFVTGDCAHNGHWGYAYVGNFCGDSRDSPEGSLSFDADAGTKCGKGKICFAYTVPETKILPTGMEAPGSIQITLQVMQNGAVLATMLSPVLTTGTHHCFEIDPASIAGLDPALGGFDLAATANPKSGNIALAPIKVGAAPDGIRAGSNNDYQIECKAFSYAVKFVCGTQAQCDCTCGPVLPGRYATEINIYNQGNEPAEIIKYVIPVVFGGAAAGREPRTVQARAEDRIRLPPYSATMDDCCRLSALLLGAEAQGPTPLSIGYLEIVSPVELTVTAVYTASGPDGGPVSIEVERIEAKPRSAPPRSGERPR